MQGNPPEESLYLSDQLRVMLSTVLDCLVPATDSLPGAGGLGVAGYVERNASRIASTRRLLSEGLEAIEVTSVNVLSRQFINLSNDDKVEVLKHVETESPGFFEYLVQHAYVGYYSNPTVLREKRLPSRPPQPEGYELAEFDDSLLDNVRKRTKSTERRDSQC